MATTAGIRYSQVLRLMRQFQQAYAAAEDEYRRELGLNDTDLRALNALGVNNQLSPGQLGDRLSISTAGITSVLDRLAEHGYIRREDHPQDRRKKMIMHGENFPGLPQQAAGRLRGIYRAFRELDEQQQHTVLGFLHDACQALEPEHENETHLWSKGT
ncbi:MarR family winged helix-turn-helix transcriptional regulator [Glutamicibacter arilaitensis]|uniref:MarR family winged helix-turn-helix transcriptional regulator n=1 Tax=Glutamicibacter arilaitensis TaxID=256701 RepID=UPI00384FEBDD